MTKLIQLAARILGPHWTVTLGRLAGRSLNLVRYRDWYFPLQIPLETFRACNRTCWYCPNSSSKLANNEVMSDGIFEICLQRMREINWRGPVYYGLYSEPLLDEKLIWHIRRTLEVLPKALPRLFSNGDFMTDEWAERLVNVGLVRCRISKHVGTAPKDWDDRIGRICKRYPNVFNFGHFPWNDKGSLLNRGGLIKSIPMRPGPCQSPSHAMPIDYAGNVLLCCDDYERKVKFGNVVDDSIPVIWKRYSAARKKLRSGARPFSMCKACAPPA